LADALHSFPATKTMGEIKKVTTSQDDDFVEVLKKNIQNKLALMGQRPV
jgi:hypothetical protein